MNKNQLEAIRLMAELHANQNKIMADVFAKQNESMQELIASMVATPAVPAPPAIPATPAVTLPTAAIETPAVKEVAKNPPPTFTPVEEDEPTPLPVQADVPLPKMEEVAVPKKKAAAPKQAAAPSPIEQPVQAKASDVAYTMILKTEKPCVSCPFAATCTVKDKSDIIDNCGINEAKAFAAVGGKLAVEVTLDEETYKTSFKVFKDGKRIGDVLNTQKDNKPMLHLLEKYPNKRFFLDAQPKDSGTKGTAGSIFSIFTCKFTSMESLSVPMPQAEPVQLDPVPAAPVQEAAPLSYEDLPFSDFEEPAFTEEELAIKPHFSFSF